MDVVWRRPVASPAPLAQRVRARAAVSQCRACSLHPAGPVAPALTTGGLAVVCRTPDPGMTVRRWLGAAGIVPTMMMGATQCTPSGAGGRFLAASPAQLAQCRGHVVDVLAAAGVEHVVLVGEQATGQWQGQGYGLSTLAGKIATWVEVGSTCMAIPEPARGVNGAKVVSALRRYASVVNDHIPVSDLFDPECAGCEGWGKWMSRDGLMWCNGCWKGDIRV